MFLLFKKSYDFTKINSFLFNYTVGSAFCADLAYKLSLEDGVYTATVKKRGVAEENADVFTVDEGFVNKLAALLTANKVGKWNGFSKSDKRVADGKSFVLSVISQNGETMKARGHMKWPKNFFAVKASLDVLFTGLYKNE